MPTPDPVANGDELRRELRRHTRRGFAGAVAAVASGAAGWTWFLSQPREGRINRAMRKALELHERLGRATFRASSRAQQYPVSTATMPIVNGTIGLSGVIDPDAWRLRVVPPGGEGSAREFTLDDVRALSRVEMTTELRCVEGWSTVVRWSGVRFRDFIETTGLAARPDGRLAEYVGIETPGGGYYVGLDMAAAMHPQTLLCDAMDGRPLAPEHGAPLRLSTPVKYGYKSIKRIGTIRFTDRRPADYWAEQGFDWYAGL